MILIILWTWLTRHQLWCVSYGRWSEETEGGHAGLWTGRECRQSTSLSCQTLRVLPVQMVSVCFSTLSAGLFVCQHSTGRARLMCITLANAERKTNSLDTCYIAECRWLCLPCTEWWFFQPITCSCCALCVAYLLLTLLLSSFGDFLWGTPRAPFDHIWAMIWSGARGNITITAL